MCHGSNFYLENPIWHCKVEMLALYIYSFARICDACYCLSLDCFDWNHFTLITSSALALIYACLVACIYSIIITHIPCYVMCDGCLDVVNGGWGFSREVASWGIGWYMTGAVNPEWVVVMWGVLKIFPCPRPRVRGCCGGWSAPRVVPMAGT